MVKKRKAIKLSDLQIANRQNTSTDKPYIALLTEFLKLWRKDMTSDNPKLRYEAFRDVETAKLAIGHIDLLNAIELRVKIPIKEILAEIKPLHGVTKAQIIREYKNTILEYRNGRSTENDTK